MPHLLMLFGAGALGTWSLWHYRGQTSRARDWARSPREAMPREILVVWPLLALSLLLGALIGLPFGAVRMVASLGFLCSIFAALAYMLFPLPVPRWLIPGWYTEQVDRDA